MGTKTLLTSDDLWKLVADGSRYELSNGELAPMSTVGMEHGGIVIAIAELLRRHAKPRNLGLTGTEIGFRLSRNPDTLRAPDVACVSREHLPPTELPKSFADFPPD